MDQLFRKFRPDQIFSLAQAFDTMAQKHTARAEELPPRLKARGSQLFKLWFVVDERLKAGANYIDQHPTDTEAAALYLSLVEARDAIHITLNSHWTEDFRLTVAKILFDAEEIDLPNDTTNDESTGSDGPIALYGGVGQEPGGEDRQPLSEAKPPG